MCQNLPSLLLITRNFPPLWGGMERLNWHLADELSRSAQVTVIAPKGAGKQAPSQVIVEEVALKPLARFLVEASIRAWRTSRALRPKIVLAGSGLTAPIALAVASQVGAKAAAYVHGLDLAVNHVVYRRLWLPAIRRLDRVIANSRATAQLAEARGIRPACISIVPPGVALPKETPKQRAGLRQNFRVAHSLQDRQVLITVGRLTQRKGVSAFVREVMPRIAQANPKVCLLVVGEAPNAALSARPDPPQAILAAAREAGVAKHVRCLGPLFGENLKAAWYGADVHVFPVRHDPDDPEGFGMVAIEAAAHGLPTVAYATGGVVDAVADGLSGKLVPPGDAQGFAQAVLEMLASPLDQQKIEAFAAQFAWPKFGDRLISLFLSY